MADGLNKVLLLGNVGRDPELRTTQGGKTILQLSLATSESYMDRDQRRQERTEWHKVVIFGRRAEGLSRYVSKGAKLFIEGSLRTSSYDDREGNKRYKTEVIANNILFAGGDRRAQQPSEHEQAKQDGYQPQDPDFNNTDDDIPF